jgi:hypothetical protein
VELRHPTAITVRDQEGETERDLAQLMRSLAQLDVRPHRLLSLTLDTRWRDEQQRERVRLGFKEEARRLRASLGDGPADAALALDLDRAAELVEERIRSAGAQGGLAVYLGGASGVMLELSSAWPLPFRLGAGHRPLLRPLVEGLRDPGRALVVVVDARSTRIYRLVGDGADLVVGVARDVPRRHKRGGWSQLHFQHHRTEQLDHHHRDAAGALVRAFDEDRAPRVLVGGRAESVGNLERFLPPRVLDRVTRVGGVDPAQGEDRILQAVDASLEELLVEEGIARVRSLEELEHEGRAAFDVESVTGALNENRVARLYLSERLCQDGWACSSCGAIGEGAADTCADCASPIEALELGEVMVRRALLQGAEVESLDGATGIDRRGGAAAELRYPTLH